MNETVLLERPLPGVVLLTLNRPDRLNALTVTMFRRMAALVASLDADPEVKVIVVTGAGRGFCSGHDLAEVQSNRDLSIGERLMRVDEEVNSLLRLQTLSTPTIAAVNGAARAGGLAVVAACDIRLASTEASFGVAFINIGISSGDGGLSWTLPRLLGRSMAAELMLTGRVIDASQAEKIGLVSRVVEPGALLPQALELAAEIAAHDMLAIWLTKRALNASGGVTLADAVAMENTSQVIAMDSAVALEKNLEFLNRPVRTAR